jgi:hypothetical protein
VSRLRRRESVPKHRRRTKRHPIRKDPVAIRLSDWTLSRILVAFVGAVLSIAAAGGGLIHFVGKNPGTFAEGFRKAFGELLNPGALIQMPGEEPAFYLVAIVLALLGLFGPIFLLGAFVFKLFVNDPIVWREVASLQDRYDVGAVVVFRFYNATRRPLLGVTVRVFALVESTGRPLTVAHLPMMLLLSLRGSHTVAEQKLELVAPFAPFIIQMPLTIGRADLAASREVAGQDAIDLQGRFAAKAGVRFLVSIDGTVSTTGMRFASVRTYDANTQLLQGHFQSIDPDYSVPPRRWAGWSNFDGNADLLIFVYDENANAYNLARALGVRLTSSAEPTPGILAGWQRTWNVGAQEGFLSESGTPLVLARLGIEEKDGAGCTGVLIPVGFELLDLIDQHYKDFHRVDVTKSIAASRSLEDCSVFAYVPTKRAVNALARACANGTAALDQEEFTRVESAFAQLGRGYQEKFREETPSPSCPIVSFKTGIGDA